MWNYTPTNDDVYSVIRHLRNDLGLDDTAIAAMLDLSEGEFNLLTNPAADLSHDDGGVARMFGRAPGDFHADS